MSCDQITVRRRRLVQKAPFTSEEAEYTVTVEKREGSSITNALNAIDSAITRMLDRKLPFTSENIPTKSAIEEDRFATLYWKQSEKATNLSTLRLSKNPNEIERELDEKTRNGKYYEAGITYEQREFQGDTYIYRWKPVK